MSLDDTVRTVIASTLKVPRERVTATTTSADLPQWDSIGHVNLMMNLEQSFDLMLDVEDFPKLTSVPAILTYLKDNNVEGPRRAP